jgi:hypothetical protein
MRKMFFSEEKNKKTFISSPVARYGPGRQRVCRQEQKLFASFFQKRGS